MRVLESATVEETEALGERLGAILQPDDFIGLSGDLGAGKTALSRGLARGLGVPPEAQVSSPTFALVNAYRGGRLPLFHADLYRVKDAEELYDAGIYDLIDAGSVLVVEWIDRVRAFAPEDWLEIVIAKRGEGRELSLIGYGPRSRELAKAV